nr:hypothetical protein [Rhodopirellula europaea]
MTWHPADALEQSEASNHTPQDSMSFVQPPRQAQPGLRGRPVDQSQDFST